MTLTKAELADNLFNELGIISKQDAKQLVDYLFDEIKNTLVSNEPVKISGFGNFATRNKTARPGRNPKTGEDVDIVARRVVVFHAGLKLRGNINANVQKLLETIK